MELPISSPRQPSRSMVRAGVAIEGTMVSWPTAEVMATAELIVIRGRIVRAISDFADESGDDELWIDCRSQLTSAQRVGCLLGWGVELVFTTGHRLLVAGPRVPRELRPALERFDGTRLRRRPIFGRLSSDAPGKIPDCRAQTRSRQPRDPNHST